MLRTARSRIEHRCHQRRLVLRLRAIAAAENEIVLTQQDVYGAFELQGRSDDEAEGEELAEGLRLFVGYFYSED